MTSITLDDVIQMRVELASLNADFAQFFSSVISGTIEEESFNAVKDEVVSKLDTMESLLESEQRALRMQLSSSDTPVECASSNISVCSPSKANRNMRVSKRRPLTMDKFLEKYCTDVELFISSNGKHICSVCENADVDIKNMCSTCYYRFLLKKRHDDPRNYRTCKVCKQPSEFHASKIAESCLSCYNYNWNALHRKKKGLTSTKKSKGRRRCLVPMSQEEFDRTFMESDPQPFILTNGKQVCSDCKNPRLRISVKNRCIKCYSKWLFKKRTADPKSYRECTQCNRVRFHQGLRTKICHSCYETTRRFNNDNKRKIRNQRFTYFETNTQQLLDTAAECGSKQENHTRISAKCKDVSYDQSPDFSSFQSCQSQDRKEASARLRSETTSAFPFDVGRKQSCDLASKNGQSSTVIERESSIDTAKQQEKKVNSHISCVNCGENRREFKGGSCFDCFIDQQSIEDKLKPTPKQEESTISGLIKQEKLIEVITLD